MATKAFDCDSDTCYSQGAKAYGTQVAGNVVPLKGTQEATDALYQMRQHISNDYQERMNQGQSKQELGLPLEPATILPLRDPRK